jgi:hypothetical protein
MRATAAEPGSMAVRDHSFGRIDIDGTACTSDAIIYPERVRAAHGGLVLAGGRSSGLVWAPGQGYPIESDVTIVGYPLRLERSLRRE